ncbi:SCO2322 family protein [Streptomyces atriruber]|uniref:SCO2322 family protein n=1 Tax=Streptomyces atriruber TaxID=545121 RepID=UPI0006E41330|nr:SCO2322 family protein [Streptomyces atriruber]
MTRGRVRRGRVVVGAFLAALLGVLAAAPAQAAGYRYWSFWERDGAQWTYATQGPGTARPDDGDVQGFRFSVSDDSKDSAQPRGPADFADICKDTPAKDGRKRVGLVVDFGTAGDAPDGERPPKPRTACAQVGEDATSAEALAAVAEPLRYDNKALLCAIEDYPKSGCGEQVSGDGDPSGKKSGTTEAQADTDEGDSGPSVGLIAGIAAVALLGGAGIWQARRRRG